MQQVAGQPAAAGVLSTLFAATEPSLAGGWGWQRPRVAAAMVGRLSTNSAARGAAEQPPLPCSLPAGRSGQYLGPFYWRAPNWFSKHFPATANLGQVMTQKPANSAAKDPDARWARSEGGGRSDVVRRQERMSRAVPLAAPVHISIGAFSGLSIAFCGQIHPARQRSYFPALRAKVLSCCLLSVLPQAAPV
jgi:hypothetical protein